MLKQLLSVLVSATLLMPAGAGSDQDSQFRSKLTKTEEISHALSRLTYGARPGDVERVKRLGMKKWIDQQLNPDRIPESAILAERLEPLDSLDMSQKDLVANYPPPQFIVAIANGRLPLPADPAKKGLYEKLAARYKQRIEKKDKDGDSALKPADKKPLGELLTPQQMRTLRNGSEDERADVLRSLSGEKLSDVLFSLNERQRKGLFAYAPVDARRRMLQNVAPNQVVQHDLWEGKLYRAIYSNRQLAEVLSDFWFNHFNVYLDKGADRFLVTSYERDAIRPNVLGNFRTMLQATAEHPAMLWYLDNWQSVAPDAARNRRRVGAKRQRGLNENYARELLELHTLGVDGGYTQKDIIEVARCFTGWTIRDPYRGGGFEFDARMHDKGEKTVLGVRIPAGGGVEDGLKVLDIVSRHPSTARFVSKKLAIKFVSDAPPVSLVESMAKTFEKTNGDLKAVMKTMLESREFWSKGAYRAKIKSPLDMVVSSVRATGADVQFAYGLANKVSELGQPLYKKQEPTGYYDFYEEWVSSAGLLARMNFALALTQNKLPGTKVDTGKLPDDTDAALKSLLAAPASQTTRSTIGKGAAEKNPAVIAALVLGSPEFQRK